MSMPMDAAVMPAGDARLAAVFDMLVARLDALETTSAALRARAAHADESSPAGTPICGVLHTRDARPCTIVKQWDARLRGRWGGPVWVLAKVDTRLPSTFFDRGAHGWCDAPLEQALGAEKLAAVRAALVASEKCLTLADVALHDPGWNGTDDVVLYLRDTAVRARVPTYRVAYGNDMLFQTSDPSLSALMRDVDAAHALLDGGHAVQDVAFWRMPDLPQRVFTKIVHSGQAFTHEYLASLSEKERAAVHKCVPRGQDACKWLDNLPS